MDCDCTGEASRCYSEMCPLNINFKSISLYCYLFVVLRLITKVILNHLTQQIHTSITLRTTTNQFILLLHYTALH